MDHAGHGGHQTFPAGAAGHRPASPPGGGGHHAMVAEYRRRFWVSLAVTIPILALSPFIQDRPSPGSPWRFLASAINGEGSLEVVVEKTGAEHVPGPSDRPGPAGAEGRSRSQNLADRAAFVLVLVALSVGAATLAVWLLVGRGFEFSLERSITVMVIACPHALGLAIPLVVAVSTALGAKSGVLIRDRTAFERSRSVNAVVFDKTGTLTEGRFGVVRVWAFADRKEAEIVALAASLESRSEAQAPPQSQDCARRPFVEGNRTVRPSASSSAPSGATLTRMASPGCRARSTFASRTAFSAPSPRP